MSAARTARRRRKQAAQNQNQLCRKQRPYYKKRSKEAAERHDRQLRITAQRIAQGRNKKKGR